MLGVELLEVARSLLLISERHANKLWRSRQEPAQLADQAGGQKGVDDVEEVEKGSGRMRRKAMGLIEGMILY